MLVLPCHRNRQQDLETWKLITIAGKCSGSTRHGGLVCPPHIPYGLQWTLSTAKSTYISHDWSRVEWSGVHWSPLDCPVHLESIWTFTTLESYWSGLDSTGPHWIPWDLQSLLI